MAADPSEPSVAPQNLGHTWITSLHEHEKTITTKTSHPLEESAESIVRGFRASRRKMRSLPGCQFRIVSTPTSRTDEKQNLPGQIAASRPLAAGLQLGRMEAFFATRHCPKRTKRITLLAYKNTNHQHQPGPRPAQRSGRLQTGLRSAMSIREKTWDGSECGYLKGRGCKPPPNPNSFSGKQQKRPGFAHGGPKNGCCVSC